MTKRERESACRIYNNRIAAAKARTLDTPLTSCTCAKRGDVRNCTVHGWRANAPLTRIAYTAVAIDAQGREYLSLCRVLSDTREGAQNSVDTRNRIDAHDMQKGKVDRFDRVVRVEIREIEEEDAS